MNLEKEAKRLMKKNDIEITDDSLWRWMKATKDAYRDKVVVSARKVENPCDSCQGACESERETVRCSASKAYDDLQSQINTLDSIK